MEWQAAMQSDEELRVRRTVTQRPEWLPAEGGKAAMRNRNGADVRRLYTNDYI